MRTVTQADFDALSSRPEPALMPEFIGLGDLRTLDVEVAAALSRLKKSAAGIEADSAALDPGLRPEVRGERIRKIKERRHDEMASAVEKIVAGKDAATSQEHFWMKNTYLLRVRFDPDPVKDATIRGAWLHRLEKLSSGMLLELARYAAAKRDPALISALVEEMTDRTDVPAGNKRASLVMLSTVPLPCDEAAEIFERLKLASMECLAIFDNRTGSGTRKIAIGLQKNRTREIHADPDAELPHVSELTGQLP